MLQSPLKPLTELTGCTKSSMMSCLPFGSAAQIQCVTTVFSPVQFFGIYERTQQMVFGVTQRRFAGRKTSGQTCAFRADSPLQPATSSSPDVTDGPRDFKDAVVFRAMFVRCQPEIL